MTDHPRRHCEEPAGLSVGRRRSNPKLYRANRQLYNLYSISANRGLLRCAVHTTRLAPTHDIIATASLRGTKQSLLRTFNARGYFGERPLRNFRMLDLQILGIASFLPMTCLCWVRYGLARLPFDRLRVTTLSCHLTFRGPGFYNLQRRQEIITNEKKPI